MIGFIFVLVCVVAVAYVLWGRPYLESWGVVDPFPGEVGTWRDRIAAYVWRSTTLVWNKFVALVSLVFTIIMSLADTLGLDGVKENLGTVFKNYPELVTAGVLAVALISILTRLRTLKE